MRNRKFLAYIVVLSMVMTLLAGCGQGGSQPAAPQSGQAQSGQQQAAAPAAPAKQVPGVTKDSIAFGTWMPLTGPAAQWGIIGRSIEAYFKFINETQGGVHGRKLQLIIEDDQYQPSKTVAAVKKMVEQDKVFGFVGGLGTPNGTAVLDYIIQNGVPHIAPSTGSVKWSTPPKKLYIAWQLNYGTEAGVLTKYGVETLKKKKFAVFYQNDDYGREGLEGAREYLKKRGAELVAEVSYNTTDADVSAQALKLKQSGAEAVLGWPTVKHAALMVKEAKKIGYDPVWLWSGTVNDPTIMGLSDNLAEGNYFIGWLPNHEDESNPIVREFRTHFPKYAPGQPLTKFGVYGWGQGRLLVEALKRAGPDLDRDKLMAAFETFKDWPDLVTVTYTATDRRGATKGWIEQAKGGKIVKITDPIAAD